MPTVMWAAVWLWELLLSIVADELPATVAVMPASMVTFASVSRTKSLHFSEMLPTASTSVFFSQNIVMTFCAESMLW
jgi:hypothetical protein